MPEVIAGLERLVFAFEKDVETQKGTGLLPFQGMDKSGAAVCTFFAKGLCEKGKLCPFWHDPGGEDGGVQKGAQCKMLGFSGDCNKECPFLHVKPAFKTQDCPLRKYQHVCSTMCTNYVAGFCPEGPRCQFAQERRSFGVLPPSPLAPLSSLL
ncbi:hypothetical protein FD754_004006 [Muntiacus muntjak]|uniref:Cleavage and polyadenylation specificity factor subunit 4 n=1 Tax=Muntiacus muntjak TaxID=9888 RepID=A0A5N3WDL9_MUNMU|nr:hypothetical protein FD754_004006 [Muntiacus muntjak]